jgi:uroporphyrinogen III methyltransferase / synthase
VGVWDGIAPRDEKPVKVVVTRPRAQAGPLVERLEALGHEVVECPLIEIVPAGDEPVDTSGYDWVVVTSPNGAEHFARRRRGPLPRVAAVGPGTAEALRACGIEPALVPRVSTQEGLLDDFPRPPGRVLVAAARGARRMLVDGLGADFVALYDTALVRPAYVPGGDLVLLASGSAARSFAALGSDMPAATIGPQTTRVATDLGLRVVAEAPTHDLDGLVEAVRLAEQWIENSSP